MKVLVTGGRGLIGSRLVQLLRSRGDDVVLASRRGGKPSASEVIWDTKTGRFSGDALSGIQAVVHLAGAGIGDRRWNQKVKAEILNSRIEGTRQVVDLLDTLGVKPVRLLSASAIGYYGNRGDETVAEDAKPGGGFLADVVQRWENEASRAAQNGHAVAQMRTGIVLDAKAGALGKQLPLFKLGLGAALGSGRQWSSWIHIHDEVSAIAFLLDHPEVTGPVNLVAPNPVTNLDFTKTLGRALSRPAVLKAPAFALSAALGREMATELLLFSQRVTPSVLAAAGFEFVHEKLYSALADLLWA